MESIASVAVGSAQAPRDVRYSEGQALEDVFRGETLGAQYQGGGVTLGQQGDRQVAAGVVAISRVYAPFSR